MNQNKFKILLQEQRNRVFSYSCYFLRNREDAEDVTQEVFIKLWKNMHKIDKRKIVPWIIQVTHNCCIDRVRKRKSVKETPKYVSSDNLDKIMVKTEKQADPELSFESNETHQILLSALHTLPERTKSMLLLHYFQGLKYKAIGTLLNTDAGAVKVAIHRGRKMLREKLTPHFIELTERCSDE
jgi:RNA polymerase sigma-70 factor (ECF subfamily)